jgi:hypothetical protein
MTADFSSANAPSFFKALFNSVHEIRVEDKKLVSRKVRESHPVRIPSRTVRMTPGQVAELAADRGRGMDYILNVLDSDEAPSILPEHCKDLKYGIEKAGLEEIRVAFQGKSDGCYAVFPVNHSKLIETLVDTGEGRLHPVKTLRSHQTLLAIALEPGTRSVVLRPRIILTPKQLGLQMVTGLLCIGAWAVMNRRREETAPD